MTLQTVLLATFVAVSVGEKPEPEIAAAAREFTNAVFRCTGDSVPVVAVSTAKHGRVEISATGPDRTTIDEKISYSVRDGNLFLTGNQPRAALHATYQFLMRELGVRWICPGPTGDIYPKRRGLTGKGDKPWQALCDKPAASVNPPDGLTSTSPRIPDAWGRLRRQHRIGLGPVNVDLGSMIIVR